jgi:uncharacterized protein (TIGR00730 family)
MAEKELAHTGITKLHVEKTMHERKRIMADLAEGFVALPGGFGTFEEIFEAITWGQLHLHQFPCAFLNVDGFYDSLAEFIRHSAQSGFIRQDQSERVIIVQSVDELFQRFDEFHPAKSEKWVSTKKI